MDNQESGMVKEILLELTSNDNAVRKAAEDKLGQVRTANPDKYFLYMLEGVKDVDVSDNARVMACVLLRRDFCPTSSKMANMWNLLQSTPEYHQVQDYIKNTVLEQFKTEQKKVILNKIGELASEISSSINDNDNKVIWEDLFTTAKELVANGNEVQMEAGINVYTESFRSIANDIVEKDADLHAMFERTLTYENLNINLCALQAVSQLLCVVQPKYAPKFIGLLEFMVKVPMKAAQAQDESVLEDALIEFNSMADAEPKFFKDHFEDLFKVFNDIIKQSDDLSSSVKHQPIEFLVTVVERQPSLMQDNEGYLKELLDTVFKLMIDIEDEIDDTWGDPKDPAQVKEEVDEDTVVFGKEVIDRLCSSIGEDIMLPLICQLVEVTIKNEDNWRFKNAGLSAFSQIAEYVADIDQVKDMIPTVIDHCKHPHPKVRHSAVHCLGQFATDLKHQFTENYHETVIPAFHERMDDEVNRVKAHACGSLSNFLEKSAQDIGVNYCETLLKRLIACSQSDSSYVAGNAVTCISSLAESCQDKFTPFYDEIFEPFVEIIKKPVPDNFRKFKGQLVESICISSVCIEIENFRPYADRLVEAILVVQKNYLTSDADPQKKYLLAAWQRLCLLLEKEFAKYLPEVLPAIFQMASLQPSLKVGGSGEDILEYLTETETASGTKGVGVSSDEIEEKNIGIQMLCVFIDELEELYADYIEDTSKLFLSLLEYNFNVSVREATATSLATMLKAVKATNSDTKTLEYAQMYIKALFEAMETESDTTVMQNQVAGIKGCIDVMGEFLDESQVNHMKNIFFTLIEKSDVRKNMNTKYTEENELGDDEVDVQNRQFMEEENDMEDDLQLAISDAFGALFKTHKDHCQELLKDMFTEKLPKYLAEDAPIVKQKFALYVIIDMVEHLGLEILKDKYEDCFKVVAKYANSINPVLRQASCFGLGVSAKEGGEYFRPYAKETSEALKNAIEME